MGKSFHQKILAESDYHKRQGLYAEYYESVYTFLTPFNTRKSCGGMKIDLVIKYNAIFAGKRVLDFGCGLGDVSMELAKRAQQVYGLDASESAIEAAKKNAEGLENVEFFVNSDLGLPFEDESLDAVYSCDLLEHLHPEDAAIHVSEVCRILSKGGKYLFWTPGSRTGPHDCTQCFYPKGMGFKSKADHLKEYRNDEVEALLRKAGFARVEFPSSAIEVLALATKV